MPKAVKLALVCLLCLAAVTAIVMVARRVLR
jgi:hypothetical protein